MTATLTQTIDAPWLNAQIREVQKTSSNPGTQATCEALMARFTPDQYEELLRLTLPKYIQAFNPTAPKPPMVRSLPTPVTNRVSNRTTAPKLKPEPQKSQASRDAEWRFKQDNAAISWGYSASQKKFVKDCTEEDFRKVAAFRFEQAKGLTAAGEKWLSVADLLKAEGAKTFADVPTKAVIQTLGRVDITEEELVS